MPRGRILIVDADRAFGANLAAELRLEGYEVVASHGGEATVSAATARPFDLALTDSVEAFRALRARNMMGPVALMTGSAPHSALEAALEEGAFTILTKPFDVVQVMITFERAARVPMVLVVDDAEPVAISTAASLCEAGVRARPVSSAGQAIGAVMNGGIDVCVLNVVVAELAGPELAQKLREIDPQLGVIAVARPQKPVQVRELIRTIALARAPKPMPV